jgi:hypothetical protein
MKEKLTKTGVWVMGVASAGLITLGILYMVMLHNYAIGACHFIWAIVAFTQSVTLITSQRTQEENKLLQGELIKAGEDNARNAHIIASKDRALADMKEHFESYRKRKESEDNIDWKKDREQEQLLNTAVNVMHAYLIANGINPEWKLYNVDGIVDQFPGCCVNVAKSLIEKTK